MKRALEQLATRTREKQNADWFLFLDIADFAERICLHASPR